MKFPTKTNIRKLPMSTFIPYISLPACCCTNVAALLAYAPPLRWGLYIITVQMQQDADLHVQFSDPTGQHVPCCDEPELQPNRQQDAPSRSGECHVGHVASHWKWLHRVQPAEDISPTAPERLFQAAWKIQTCRSGFINTENAELSCLKTLQWNSQKFPWQQIPRRWFGKQQQLKHL